MNQDKSEKSIWRIVDSVKRTCWNNFNTSDIKLLKNRIHFSLSGNMRQMKKMIFFLGRRGSFGTCTGLLEDSLIIFEPFIYLSGDVVSNLKNNNSHII